MNIVCTFPVLAKAFAETAVGLGLIFGLAGLAHCTAGCGGPVLGDGGSIDAAYRAEPVGCSVQAKTLAASKECRRLVNKRYGLCERAEWPRITPCDD